MTDQAKHRALLDRLEAERARSAEGAARTGIAECVISHSSQAEAYRIAGAHLLDVFEGPEAADEYMREVGLPGAAPAPDDGLRKQYAAAVDQLWDSGGVYSLEDCERDRIAAAVFAVRDRHMEQLAARVAELEKQVAEDAEDYAELADHTDATCEAVQRRNTAEAAVERVRDLAADMRTWCSPRGIAVDYADRIDEALEGPAVERTEGAR